MNCMGPLIWTPVFQEHTNIQDSLKLFLGLTPPYLFIHSSNHTYWGPIMCQVTSIWRQDKNILQGSHKKTNS